MEQKYVKDLTWHDSSSRYVAYEKYIFNLDFLSALNEMNDSVLLLLF